MATDVYDEHQETNDEYQETTDEQTTNDETPTPTQVCLGRSRLRLKK